MKKCLNCQYEDETSNFCPKCGNELSEVCMCKEGEACICEDDCKCNETCNCKEGEPCSCGDECKCDETCNCKEEKSCACGDECKCDETCNCKEEKSCACGDECKCDDTCNCKEGEPCSCKDDCKCDETCNCKHDETCTCQDECKCESEKCLCSCKKIDMDLVINNVLAFFSKSYKTKLKEVANQKRIENVIFVAIEVVALSLITAFACNQMIPKQLVGFFGPTKVTYFAKFFGNFFTYYILDAFVCFAIIFILAKLCFKVKCSLLQVISIFSYVSLITVVGNILIALNIVFNKTILVVWLTLFLLLSIAFIKFMLINKSLKSLKQNCDGNCPLISVPLIYCVSIIVEIYLLVVLNSNLISKFISF